LNGHWTISVLKNGGHLSPVVQNILLLTAEVTRFSHLIYGLSEFQNRIQNSQAECEAKIMK